MVIRYGVPFLQEEQGGLLAGSRPSKGLPSPGLESTSSPLSSESTKLSKIQRKYSLTSTVSVAGPESCALVSAKPMNVDSSSKSARAQAGDDSAATTTSDPATQEFYGDIVVSTALPSKSTLEEIADLQVSGVDGQTVPFKSLYWSDGSEGKKVMIIFIRHFFCGNCQEYLRTLAAAIPPSALPSNTSIRIVGCGSHTLIPSYIEQTSCPYPIFADPSKKLYSVLGMARTLSLGNKDPDYIQHALVTGMVKSIAQGLKRLGSGDAMQGGDMKQVGGEFLFEVQGGDTRLPNAKEGNGALKKARVRWCHRMKNTRDHAELPELRSVLGLEKRDGEEGRRRSESSWRSSGLARSLSSTRQSLSWSRTRRRSKSTERKDSPDSSTVPAVQEEPRAVSSEVNV